MVAVVVADVVSVAAAVTATFSNATAVLSVAFVASLFLFTNARALPLPRPLLPVLPFGLPPAPAMLRARIKTTKSNNNKKKKDLSFFIE